MKYLSLLLEVLPKKTIAIFILQKAKNLVENTNNSFDNIAYEMLLNSLIKIGFLNENDAINNEL